MKRKKKFETKIVRLFLLLAIIIGVSIPAAAMECKADDGTIPYVVSAGDGSLALRTEPVKSKENIIGWLHTGDPVIVFECTSDQYWYVFASTMELHGYVNKDYLTPVDNSTVPVSYTSSSWTVKVDQGYLALRTAKAYDETNEIGELYTGEIVELLDNSDAQYWYVYSPKYRCNGYVNKDYLYMSNTGITRTVSVSQGYLALRTAKAYDASNEIGELYTGDTVQILNTSDDQYWYVYSPKYNTNGYVNKDYLTGGNVGEIRTVSVSQGYLALRTAKAYDAANEIGELYTGDTVQILNTSDDQYWYVYAPKYNKNGYVNKDYLLGSRVIEATRTVSVSKGYLALRTAKAYDASNEIGELYTGDTVQLIDTSDSEYWYVYSPKHGINGYVNAGYLY